MRNTELHYGRKKYTKSVGSVKIVKIGSYTWYQMLHNNRTQCTVLLYNMQALAVYVTLFSIPLDKLVMYIL